MFRRNSHKNKQRQPLGRSKSMNAIVRNPVDHLEFIDPRVAQRDAHIAARLSYYRAHGQHPSHLTAMSRQPASHGLSRSDSIVSRADTARKSVGSGQPGDVMETTGLKRQQSIRFTGSNARPRRALAARAIENPMLSLQKADTYSSGISGSRDEASFEGNALYGLPAPEYYTVEDDMTSIQSSYRKLRKSKSLFNSSNLAHSEYSFSTRVSEQPKKWDSSRYASLNKENELASVPKKPGLRAPKSMSFLSSRREQQPSRVSSRTDMNPAVQLAREKFQQQMEQQKRLKSQPSLFFRSKQKRSESSMGLRKSLRHSSNTSAAMSSAFSGDTVLVQKPAGLRRTARKVSNSLKNKIKGLFGRTKSSEDTDCLNDKSADSDGESCIVREKETCGYDEASISQVHSHVPSLHAVPSDLQLRSRQGSMESLNAEDQPVADDKSRVTSWTNSTAETFAASSVVGEWEGQRLSIIKENGMHLSSTQARPTQAQGPLPGVGTTIDSQRIYSALMKRLEETKLQQQLREKSVEDYREFGIAPPRGSSVDRAESQDWSPPTIRCVRADDDVFHHDVIVTDSTAAHREQTDLERDVKSPELITSHKLELPNYEVGDVKPSPTKINTGRSESRQPRTLSQRSSAFFASPTCHLFRTASPYRRALRENMKVAEQTQRSQPDLHYLKSLSSLSLPLRQLSTTGSDRDIYTTGAESVYSHHTESGKMSTLEDNKQLVDSFPQPPKSQTHGDVTIFVDQPGSRVVRTPMREFSAASSVEWKTWLSSHVSKLEGPTISAKGDEPSEQPGLLPALGHVREHAEIDSPGDAISLTKVQVAGPLKALEGNKVVLATPRQPQKPTRTASYATDENAAPISEPEIRKLPSASSRSSLREFQPGCRDENSQCSLRENEGISRARNIAGSIGSSPLTREEILRRRRARMGTARGSVSPAKSSPGLSMAVDKQFGKATTGSPRPRLEWRGQRSVPSLRNEAGLSRDNLNETNMLEPEIEPQVMGSRKMVEMFLSSRRSIADRRSGTGSEGSPSVFL